MIIRTAPDYEAAFKDKEPPCNHALTVIRKMLQSNGVAQIKKQCTTCGDSVGNALKQAAYSPAQLAALPAWDETIAKHYHERLNKQHTELVRRADEHAYNDWNRKYQAYLKTHEWQARRKLVLLRAQGICEGCRAALAEEVHHVSYRHAGEEFLFQLVALCAPCHERFHATMPTPSGLPPNTPSSPNPK